MGLAPEMKAVRNGLHRGPADGVDFWLRERTEARSDRRGRNRGVPLFFVLALSASSAVAAPGAPASRDEARTHFKRGTQFFDERDFAAALVEFRRANELAPNFRILFNIGQTCAELQDYPCAYQSFTRYLAEGGTQVKAGRIVEIERELDKIKARVARVEVSTNVPGAEVSVDDVPVGTTPLLTPPMVGIGRRRISASLQGHVSATKVIEVAGGDLVPVLLELTPIAPPPPVAAPAPKVEAPRAADGDQAEVPKSSGRGETREIKKRPSLWLWLLPAVLAGGGIGIGQWATRVEATMREKQKDLAFPQEKLLQMSEEGKVLALFSDIVSGVAVISGVILALLTLFPPTEHVSGAQRSGASLEFGLGPGGIAVSGHF
jgi:hypothetical protein